MSKNKIESEAEIGIKNVFIHLFLKNHVSRAVSVAAAVVLTFIFVRVTNNMAL